MARALMGFKVLGFRPSGLPVVYTDWIVPGPYKHK